MCKSVENFKSNLKTHFFKKLLLDFLKSNLALDGIHPLIIFMNITWVSVDKLQPSYDTVLFAIIPFILYIFMIYCQESDYFMYDPIVYTCFMYSAGE